LSKAFRSQAPGLSKRAKRLANQARALVVNGNLTPVEAAALRLETTWSMLLTRPAPPFDGCVDPPKELEGREQPALHQQRYN
jgi:hypothetical protein